MTIQRKETIEQKLRLIAGGTSFMQRDAEDALELIAELSATIAAYDEMCADANRITFDILPDGDSDFLARYSGVDWTWYNSQAEFGKCYGDYVDTPLEAYAALKLHRAETSKVSA